MTRVHGRANHLLPINCAAVPETLLESELFGHVAAPLPGLSGAMPGKFALASGGTLLLDEIGEMPLQLQPKLLRVLQERGVLSAGRVQRRSRSMYG